MPAKKYTRKGHTKLNKRLIGQEERFAERAISMGVGGIDRLSKHTDLHLKEIKHIKDLARYKARLTGKTLPHSSIERLLINGELSVQEIAKLCKVSPKSVVNVRADMKKRGIITKIPGSNYPPVKVARLLLRYDVLAKLSSMAKKRCDIVATVLEEVDGSILSFFRRNPNIMKDVKTIANNRYWEKAQKQLKKWIKEQEKKYGKKYKPE